MIGILAAICAAFSWTYACFIWREQTKRLSAIELNSIKTLIAAIIFLPIIFSLNFFEYRKEISMLLASGFMGITLGDYFYIKALKYLGTRKTLTIESLSPFLANILGSIIINEYLEIKTWLGATIVSLSLIGIIRQNTYIKDVNNKNIDRGKSGVFYAILSVIFAVLAAILSRIVLSNSNLNPLQTSEIRLLGALICLLPISKLNIKLLNKEISKENKLKIILSTLLGTNLGIFFQQVVFQSLPIGLGWTLLSISPIIALLFSKSEGEKINSKSIILSFTTFVGILIAFI